jgi:YidC/Oxa1 family membrane protein insertase
MPPLESWRTRPRPLGRLLHVLEEFVSFPLWDQFQALIFEALRATEGVVGDWGMAIILLTVAIRVVLLPLTWKQTKSMAELQRIQPKIKELQQKYKDDKEKLQEETLKFYQENKVNPLGGCLPMLIQMPILFALYGVLGQRGKQLGPMLKYLADHHTVGTFYGLIPNIAKTPQSVWASHDYIMLIPYLVLVILFAVSIWLPQALMPGEKTQKNMAAVMAVVMLAFGWTAPAGVLLYWDVSSIWGVAQQQLTMRGMKQESASAEETTESSKQKDSSAPAEIANKKPSNKKPKKS